MSDKQRNLKDKGYKSKGVVFMKPEPEKKPEKPDDTVLKALETVSKGSSSLAKALEALPEKFASLIPEVKDKELKDIKGFDIQRDKRGFMTKVMVIR